MASVSLFGDRAFAYSDAVGSNSPQASLLCRIGGYFTAPTQKIYRSFHKLEEQGSALLNTIIFVASYVCCLLFIPDILGSLMIGLAMSVNKETQQCVEKIRDNIKDARSQNHQISLNSLGLRMAKDKLEEVQEHQKKLENDKNNEDSKSYFLEKVLIKLNCLGIDLVNDQSSQAKAKNLLNQKIEKAKKDSQLNELMQLVEGLALLEQFYYKILIETVSSQFNSPWISKDKSESSIKANYKITFEGLYPSFGSLLTN